MKKFNIKLAALLLPVVFAGAGLAFSGNAHAVDISGGVSSGIESTSSNSSLSDKSADDLITNIINFLLFAVGIVAVIMLILGGFRYVTSNGDSNQVTAAKNTILYAIVGLVIAIFAYAIVNFVVKGITD